MIDGDLECRGYECDAKRAGACTYPHAVTGLPFERTLYLMIISPMAATRSSRLPRRHAMFTHLHNVLRGSAHGLRHALGDAPRMAATR